MKKTFLKLIALAVLLCTVFSITSCGLFTAKPELDLKDAAKALEDEDYSVYHYDDEDDLSVGVAERLSARSDDGDDYLYITVYETTKMAKLAYEELELENEAEIEYIKLEIKTLEYTLKKFEKDLTSDEIDEIEDEIKELEKYLEEMKDEYCFGRKGKAVWEGTKDAIKDSKD